MLPPPEHGATFNGGPVAVDILNDATKNAHLLTDAIKDDNLELVVGGTIFSVNIGAGTINAEKTIPNFGKKDNGDATSIADFNLDGSLDVIATGRNTNNNDATVFFLGCKNEYCKNIFGSLSRAILPLKLVLQKQEPIMKTDGTRVLGRINIADLDGDGQLNLAYVSGKFLYALKEDLTPLWPK